MKGFRALACLILTVLLGAFTANAGTSITFNGATYTVPSVADANWGQNVSNYLTAIASGTLQKTGGSFTLTNDVNFGFTYGLVSEYVKSQTVPVAGTGVLRLGNGDAVTWRNAGNTADLALSVNGSNQLIFNGSPVAVATTGSPYQVLTVPSGGGAGAYGAVSLNQSAAVTGTLGVTNGGTGLGSGNSGGVLAYTASGTLTSSNTLTANGVLYGGGAGFTPGATAAGTTGQVLLATTGAAPSWGALNLGTTAAVTGTLAVANGGTGNSSFTSNGVLYGNGSGALSVTGQGGANTILTANSGAPAWSASPTLGTSLTIGVNASQTGTLVLANGGTGGASVSIQNNGATSAYNFNLPTTAGSSGQVLTSQGGGTAAMNWTSPFTNPMTTLGDMVVGGSSGASNRLAGPTSTTKQFLTSTGTGSAANTPTWATIAGADVPVVVPGTSAGVVSANGLPGNTTGSAIASGYVGQLIDSGSQTGLTVTSSSYVTLAQITLTPGVWMVYGNVMVALPGAATGIYGGLATATNSNTGWTYGVNAMGNPVTSAAGGSVSVANYYNVSANTPVYLTSIAGGGTTTTADARLYAVRID